jgi:hypothetical protein
LNKRRFGTLRRKTFFSSGAGSLAHQYPKLKKVFLLLFLQKKKSLLPSLLPQEGAKLSAMLESHTAKADQAG